MAFFALRNFRLISLYTQLRAPRIRTKHRLQNRRISNFWTTSLHRSRVSRNLWSNWCFKLQELNWIVSRVVPTMPQAWGRFHSYLSIPIFQSLQTCRWHRNFLEGHHRSVEGTTDCGFDRLQKKSLVGSNRLCHREVRLCEKTEIRTSGSSGFYAKRNFKRRENSISLLDAILPSYDI